MENKRNAWGEHREGGDGNPEGSTSWPIEGAKKTILYDHNSMYNEAKKRARQGDPLWWGRRGNNAGTSIRK